MSSKVKRLADDSWMGVMQDAVVQCYYDRKISEDEARSLAESLRHEYVNENQMDWDTWQRLNCKK